MKKMITIVMIAFILLVGCGCSTREYKQPGSAIETQLSEKHQEFQEKKNMSQIMFYVCGGLVGAGVVFKIGAIITAVISGRKLAENRRKEKERESQMAWRKQVPDLDIEKLRYEEYMERRQKEKDKSS